MVNNRLTGLAVSTYVGVGSNPTYDTMLYFLFHIKRQRGSKTTIVQLQVMNIYLRLKIYLKGSAEK